MPKSQPLNWLQMVQSSTKLGVEKCFSCFCSKLSNSTLIEMEMKADKTRKMKDEQETVALAWHYMTTKTSCLLTTLLSAHCFNVYGTSAR